MIRSSTEDASTKQGFFDSRTVVNTSESSRHLPQTPLQNIKCSAQKQTKENVATHSLEILRHAEKLQSLLHNVENNEIVSWLFFWIQFDVFT